MRFVRRSCLRFHGRRIGQYRRSGSSWVYFHLTYFQSFLTFDALKTSQHSEWDFSHSAAATRTTRPVVKEKRYLVPMDQRSTTAKPKKIRSGVRTSQPIQIQSPRTVELGSLRRLMWPHRWFSQIASPAYHAPKRRSTALSRTHAGFLYFVPAPHPAVELASQPNTRWRSNLFDEDKNLLNPDYSGTSPSWA